MNAEFDWEWQGINFLSMPVAFTDPLIVRVFPDIFADYTDEQLNQMFAVMISTPQHTYQVLTKQPERMLCYFQNWAGIYEYSGTMRPNYEFPLPNVWLGVTVESQATADERIPLLLQTPAAVRFLSCEPLLESVNLHFFQDCPHCDTGKIPLTAEGIDWVIVGGESGPDARPCDIAWIHSIAEQCKAANVPCFVKQLGSMPFWSKPNPFSDPSKSYRDLEFQPHRATWTGTVYTWQSTGNGNNPDEWPEDLRVRQMPAVRTAYAVARKVVA
jgi:protein gp37